MSHTSIAKILTLLTVCTGVVSAAQTARFQLSYAPVSCWFPEPPRHARASSIASDRTTVCKSEKFEETGAGYALCLTTTDFPTIDQLAQGYREDLQFFGGPGTRQHPFSHGGLEGVEIDSVTATGGHVRYRAMINGNRLVVVRAAWTDRTGSRIAAKFIDSVQLRTMSP